MSVHTLSALLHMCTYAHIESYTNIHEKWEKKDGSRGERQRVGKGEVGEKGAVLK